MFSMILCYTVLFQCSLTLVQHERLIFSKPLSGIYAKRAVKDVSRAYNLMTDEAEKGMQPGRMLEENR